MTVSIMCGKFNHYEMEVGFMIPEMLTVESLSLSVVFK